MVSLDSDFLPSCDILAELRATKDNGQALFFDLDVPFSTFESVLEANATGWPFCNKVAPRPFSLALY